MVDFFLHKWNFLTEQDEVAWQQPVFLKIPSCSEEQGSKINLAHACLPQW